jgi:hypothetical protein
MAVKDGASGRRTIESVLFFFFFIVVGVCICAVSEVVCNAFFLSSSFIQIFYKGVAACINIGLRHYAAYNSKGRASLEKYLKRKKATEKPDGQLLGFETGRADISTNRQRNKRKRQKFLLILALVGCPSLTNGTVCTSTRRPAHATFYLDAVLDVVLVTRAAAAGLI